MPPSVEQGVLNSFAGAERAVFPHFHTDPNTHTYFFDCMYCTKSRGTYTYFVPQNGRAAAFESLEGFLRALKSERVGYIFGSPFPAHLEVGGVVAPLEARPCLVVKCSHRADLVRGQHGQFGDLKLETGSKG